MVSCDGAEPACYTPGNLSLGCSMALWQRAAAELVGTFWLVLGGCGSAVLAAAFPGVGIGLLGVSLAFGLTVLTMATASGTSRVAT
jgi:glycerol uptake facilitator-like aquaporin